jgi:ferredoxin
VIGDLYEKSPAPGGTLRSSISDDVLPKNIIDLEVEIIRSLGASFYFNTLITREVYNSQIREKYDAAIVATGDIATDNYLAEIISVAKSGYQVNEKDLSSSSPGIFVCGSAIRANKMEVRSVAQGKTAADSVHKYLQHEQFEKPGRMFNSRFEKLLPEEYGEYLKESISTARLNPAGGYLPGFSADEAVKEAMRCLHCDCRKKDNCLLRTHSQEYNIDRKRYLVSERRLMTKQMQHHLIVFEPEKCIKCGLCVEISAREGEKYGLAFEGRGFDAVVNTPLGVAFNEGLSHSAKKCVTACPTGALSFRNDNYNLAL